LPPWFIACPRCGERIEDALLECIPVVRQRGPEYRLLFTCRPGAAIACPFCNGLIGFDAEGNPTEPSSGWPVVRYSRELLEMKREHDECSQMTLCAWYTHRGLGRPGDREPFTDYTYSQNAPPDETVP